MVTQLESYLAQYKEASIAFSPYVIKKLGLIQAQTLLSIDTFSLSCIPYQLGMERVVVLAMLSSNEIAFFQKYKGGLASLSLVFQRDNRQQALKIFVRCAIAQIAPMKDKEGVALVQLLIKNCPNDLAEIIGAHLSFMDRLKLQYEDFKGKKIQMSPENANLLEYNHYATLHLGADQSRVQLYALSSGSVDILAAPNTKELAQNSECLIKLYFKRFQFTLKGRVISSSRLGTGIVKSSVQVEFCPELVEIIDFYHFKSRIAKKA